MRFVRFSGNPIVSTDANSVVGDNVNGPSLIRVPDWVRHPLGRYYLYFAHHRGDGIRLAHADCLSGPWEVYPENVHRLEKSSFYHHIASPDVLVDEDNQRLLLYYHGRVSSDSTEQATGLAVSEDGVNFSDAESDDLGGPYSRIFRYGGAFFSLEMPGLLRRSESFSGPFEAGPQLLPGTTRHSAVCVQGNRLYILFTRIGDCPERILWTSVSLEGDWRRWRAATPLTLLKPGTAYEGVGLPLQSSRSGPAEGPERALRDPGVFVEGSKTYLLYSVAGEQGIAIGVLECRVTAVERVARVMARACNALAGFYRSNSVLVKLRQIWKSRSYLINKHLKGVRIEAPPTFIVGCGHSGTSIFLAILAAHSRIAAVPGESGIARLKDAEAFYRRKEGFDRATIAQGKRRWAEKTPNHILHLDTIFSRLPEAKVIIVLRNGLDVAASLKKRGGSAEEGARRWMRDNLQGKRYWDHPNVLRVKYEDLIIDFESTMKSVFDFIGEDYEVAIKDFHRIEKKWYSQKSDKKKTPLETQHNEYRNWQINQPIFDGRGKWKQLNVQELKEVERIEADLLAELGYGRSEPGPSEK